MGSASEAERLRSQRIPLVIRRAPGATAGATEYFGATDVVESQSTNNATFNNWAATRADTYAGPGWPTSQHATPTIAESITRRRPRLSARSVLCRR